MVGPVGAGKGSLVQAILGELPIASGQLSVKGRVAYTSQDPWLFQGSVRDNILFGRDFESDWYIHELKIALFHFISFSKIRIYMASVLIYFEGMMRSWKLVL